ncbi:MAG: tRNA (adenosine(37)-N6)-threonylcarbamoyltransferase complex ATPase subunit type 1 TsaE [Cocleimonas sp.]|nr:tRNA (adenosine(37)-N6)-threonylcarbamoyltransferase complex ATPase subunit type 1 TsaE [Cocleimonas sp.]
MSNNKTELFVESEQQMMQLGGKIADTFPQGGLVFLNGDLGTGKTTLVRGLLRHLGFEGTVKSPTYTLVEPYCINGRELYHFDLYRLADPEELEYMGVRDYLSSDALCLIEWPEKAQGFLPQEDLNVTLYHADEMRKVNISPKRYLI